jgi:hypothetical protein
MIAAISEEKGFYYGEAKESSGMRRMAPIEVKERQIWKNVEQLGKAMQHMRRWM